MNIVVLNPGTGLDRGNVAAILGLLQCVRDRVAGDEIMQDVTASVEMAMLQLRDLQRIAYETMLEIEAERWSLEGPSLSKRKPS